MTTSQIFQLLKSDSSLMTLDEIAKRLSLSADVVNEFVLQYAPFLLLEVHENNRYIRLARVLDRPFEEDGVQYWDFAEVLQTAPVLPETWISPYAAHVPHRGQGYLGACVGNGVAYGADILHMRLCPDDIPTEKDKAEYQENVDGNHDILYPQSASAACAYYWSREVGQITEPQGSDIRAALKAWKTRGICLDCQWIYLKDGVHEHQKPYPGKHPVTGETAESFASRHRIDGFSRVRSVEDLKNALFTHHAAFISLQIFANVDDGRGSGVLPLPGSNPRIGSHLYCAVGWNSEGIIVLDTWRDQAWPKQVLIPYAYLQTYNGGMFVPLDSEETRYAREILYSTLTVTVSEPAEIWINGKSVGTSLTTFTTPVRRLFPNLIRCVAGDRVAETTATPDTETCEIEIELLSPTPAPKSKVDEIKEKVNATLGKNTPAKEEPDDKKEAIKERVNKRLKKE